MPGFLKIQKQVRIQNLSILQVWVGNFLTPEGTFKDVPEDFDVPHSSHLLSWPLVVQCLYAQAAPSMQ